MKSLDKFALFFNNLLTGFIAVLMMISVISMFYQVLARFVFGFSAAWSEETARFAVVWLVFLGGAIACFYDSNISVTFLDSSLKGRGLRIVKTCRYVVQIAIYAFIVYISFKTLAIVASQTSPNIRISMAWMYSSMSISAVISILNLIYISLRGAAKENGNG